MPKSSKSKNKCKCGGCARCQNKKLLRITIMMKKKQNELRMQMANQSDKHGTMIKSEIIYNPETDMAEVSGFKTAGVIGAEKTMDMVKTLGKIDGGFYNINID